jgi:hypothetical protein
MKRSPSPWHIGHGTVAVAAYCASRSSLTSRHESHMAAGSGAPTGSSLARQVHGFSVGAGIS